ncbi:MAG TPA: hypothetical protein VGN07_08770 [Steroidobacteraceae bacterium]|jgi:hypothetical protein
MSIAGKWNVTMDTPIGTQQFTWDLQESAGAWTGTMNSQGGLSQLSGVKVEGDKLSFDTKVKSPMGSVNLAFSGAVSGAKVSGICKTMFGDIAFAGVRA